MQDEGLTNEGRHYLNFVVNHVHDKTVADPGGGGKGGANAPPF